MASVGDIYEVRIFSNFTAQQQCAVNVRHYRVSAVGGTGATDLTIANFIDEALFSLYKPLMHTGVSYRGVGVRRILPLPKTAETFGAQHTGAGTASGDPMPGQVCGMITLRTTYGGPRYRGRLYIPFPAEADNDTDSLPTAAYVTRATDLATALIAGLVPGAGGNTVDLLPIIYSRKFGTWQDVNAYTVRFRWGTQRSRGSYGAKNPSPI